MGLLEFFFYRFRFNIFPMLYNRSIPLYNRGDSL